MSLPSTGGIKLFDTAVLAIDILYMCIFSNMMSEYCFRAVQHLISIGFNNTDVFIFLSFAPPVNKIE